MTEADITFFRPGQSRVDLETGRDRVEGIFEVRADRLQGANKNDGDQRGDQPVFDGRSPAVVAEKLLQDIHGPVTTY